MTDEVVGVMTLMWLWRETGIEYSRVRMNCCPVAVYVNTEKLALRRLFAVETGTAMEIQSPAADIGVESMLFAENH